MTTVAPGGISYLAGQVVSEYELCQSAPGITGKRPLEEALTALRKGTLLLKHGRHGKPKVHFFRVTACDTLLKWRSASGSVKQVKLRNVTDVIAGQTTEVFKRHPLREPARSFSLRYQDEDGSTRTLDLTCADEQQYELWHAGLRVVANRLRTLGAPVGSSAAGTGAAAGSGGSAGPGGFSPAELARFLGSTALQRSVSGPVCISAAERVPCDLLAWGSAQRAPPVSLSMRSVMGISEDCWQHRSVPGLAPGGLQLDAYRAAVGRKHAAVITATGALYTWGEGRGGKLGLGHDLDQPQPRRVRHGLEGQCVVTVACGDDCTAAVTEGGELYMWGRLHVDTRPQLVPLHVRGDLRGRKVVQISCGPFHCAALASDGQLFTWGEGFGGKLGHGDQSNRTHPALVQAFAGYQVLEVACGVWHTAAVVSEGDGMGSPYPPQYSPLKAESSAPADMAGGAESAGIPASPGHAPSHNRNNSTSSAFSESSLFQDGQGGCLFTWGGVNESVAFGNSEKHDSNKGCLGHGEADLYRGQLLPVRVGGALDNRQVRHVAAGSHITVAITTGGRVFQMGATGASAAKNCPWEGATLPELVRGQLAGYYVDEVSCGMHHVVAMARPVDRRLGRPADHALRATFAWGRGTEGQLGVKSFEDSATPVVVESLKGRPVLQVTCGGSNTMAVCEHNVQRFEPDNREDTDAASRALYGLMSESKPTPSKQLRIQAPGDCLPPSREGSQHGGGGAGLVRRSYSMIAPRSSNSGGGSVTAGTATMVQYGSGGGPPDLSRISSSSVRSVGGASASGSARPSLSQMYSTLMTAHRAQKAQRARATSDRSGSGPLLLTGSNGGGGGGGGGDAGRVVSIGSPVKAGQAHSLGGYARRSTYAGGVAGGGGAGMSTARSFTMSGARSFGGRSDLSSLSSWQQRAHSEDGMPEHHEGGALGGNGHRMHSISDMAGMDDMRTSSSVGALHDELAEKNRTIERLQRKLEKMQRQEQQQQPVAARRSGGDSEERLRESVRQSADAFREAQSSPQQDSGARKRSLSSPAAVASLPLRSSISPRSLRAVGGTIYEEPEQARLQAMEQALAMKEASLEGQQRKLMAWAAELKRREDLLVAAAGQQEAGGEVGSSGGTPQPIPSVSPVLMGRAAGAATAAAAATPGISPLVRRVMEEAGLVHSQPGSRAASSNGSLPGGGGGGGSEGSTLPGSPAAPGEWTEEFEQGVFLTFTTEGGAKKLKRIRFNRSLFTADAAKEWYEANKHRLAQPTGTPRVAAAGGARSGPGTPSAQQLEAGQPGTGEQQETPPPQQQQQGGAGQDVADPAAAGAAAGGNEVVAAAGDGAAAAAGEEGSAVTGLLNYRQTSRNLSFDARELATFNDRLNQLSGQQEGQGQAASHRPSRLSRLAGPSTSGPGSDQGAAAAAAAPGGLPESPFASAANKQQQEQWASPASGVAAAVEGASGGEDGGASRGWQSAQSSPATSAASQPDGRQPAEQPGELAAMRTSAALFGGGTGGGGGSGGSSPIRASGGSRTSSPLSKQRSVASGMLTRQLSSPRSEAGRAAGKDGQPLFTPRATLEKQGSVAAAAAAAAVAAQQHQQQGAATTTAAAAAAATSDGGRSSSGSQGGSSPEGPTAAAAAADAPGSGPRRSSSSFSGTIGRLRRTLTGGGGGGKKK